MRSACWLEQDGTLHLSSTDKMLRQVSGTAELGPLGVLGKITSPEGVGVREQMTRKSSPGTQLTPLVHLTDAVVPDPPYRRQFAALVDQLLDDAPKFRASSEELTRTFQQWRDMGPGFAAMVAAAPVLDDGTSRVLQLQKLGSAGLGGVAVSAVGEELRRPNWKDAQLALVAQAETPDLSFLKLPWMRSYRALDFGGCGGRRIEGQQSARSGSRRSWTKLRSRSRRRSTRGRRPGVLVVSNSWATFPASSLWESTSV